jgi:hypothetical protein
VTKRPRDYVVREYALKSGTMSKKDRVFWAGSKCSYCGVITTLDRFTPTSLEIEHIVPRAKDGPDVDWNRTPSCRACNQFKRDSGPEFVRGKLASERGQCEVLKTQHGDDGKVQWILLDLKTGLVRFHAENLILAAVERFTEPVREA